ncbi:MAG: CHAT domain-containing protein [Bacteroidota bacterium]
MESKDLENLKKKFISSVEKHINDGFDDLSTQRLAKDGLALYNFLFKDSLSNPLDKEFVNRMFNCSDPSAPGRITIKSKSFIFDYQFLNNSKNSPNFLGNRFIISKQFQEIDHPESSVNGVPSFAYLAKAGLKNFKKIELEKLKSLNKKRIISLIDDLNKKQDVFDSLEAIDQYDVMHLACHIDRSEDEDNPLSWHLDFGKSRTVECLHLQNLKNLRSKVIFLNACRGGHISPSSRLSFSSYLCKKLISSLISADFDLPDRFAAEFAAEFWSFVFSHNRRLDLALFYSSRVFFKEGNWAGLHYSIFGNEKL